MQIQVKDIEEKKDKVFHPFVLEFKIESEDDLENLAARFNIATKDADDLNEGYGYPRKTISNDSLWNFLDSLLNNKPYMK